MAGGERFFGRLERNWRAFAGVITASGALALAGCGGGAKMTETASSAAPSSPNTGRIALTFDDLGANSSIIQVYPGVESTPQDELSNGTYNNGDIVPAECKTAGRTVHSVPPETPSRQSDEWIRIHGTPGETQYATAVYVQDPAQLLSKLPEC